MSIHIRVYPQAGSVGYNRTHRRRSSAQAMFAQRNAQLQNLRLQAELQRQSQMYSINNTMPQQQFGYGYGAPVPPTTLGGFGAYGGNGGYGSYGGYGGYGGYGSTGGYASPYGVQQVNYTNQIGGLGSYARSSNYGNCGPYGNANAWQYCATPNSVYGAQLGGGLLSGIGNMFARAFRGW